MKTITTLVLSLVAVSAFAMPKAAHKTEAHKSATTETAGAMNNTTTTTTVAKKDCATVPASEKEACMKEQAAQPKH